MRRFIYLTIVLLSLTPVWASAQSFRQVPGKLASISLGGTQTGAVAVWGIDSAQNIYSFNGLLFDSIPGSLTQISVDGNSVTGINANSDIFSTLGLSGFTQISGKLTQVSTHGLAAWELTQMGTFFNFNSLEMAPLFNRSLENLFRSPWTAQRFGELTPIKTFFLTIAIACNSCKYRDCLRKLLLADLARRSGE